MSQNVRKGSSFVHPLPENIRKPRVFCYFLLFSVILYKGFLLFSVILYKGFLLFSVIFYRVLYDIFEALLCLGSLPKKTTMMDLLESINLP